MHLEQVLNFRRSVRDFALDTPLDTARVKQCLQLATLAPSSSNMQLYEFYHITNPALVQQLALASMSQKAVSTARELVVFVTRQDLHRHRAQQVLAFERGNIQRNSPEERHLKRINDREMYYGKIIPFLYARCFGLLGLLRKLISGSVGLFRPMFRETSENDQRVVVHKSCALAVQTFMIAMANEGYDTCPIEGLDSRMVKKILKLPAGAEVNMIVSCGIRNGNVGIWGERFRVPFSDIYRHM